MLTKKDFKAVAEIIERSKDLILHYEGGLPQNDLVNGLADYFATQNPRFDRERFLNACGLGE